MIHDHSSAGSTARRHVRRPNATMWRLALCLALAMASIYALALPGHAVAATAPSGTGVSWGRNDYGQLQQGTITSGGCNCLPLPGGFSTLPANDPIVGMSGGPTHGIELTRSGGVYVGGDNQYGEYGNGQTSNPSPDSFQVTQGLPNSTVDQIVQVSAGNAFNMALTQGGQVYTWGFNGSGRLGDGTTTMATIPEHITATLPDPATDPVIQVSAGPNFALALTRSGAVYGWGANDSGQIGTGTGGADQLTPLQITQGLPNTSTDPVVHITAGATHGLAVTKSGAVYAWGRGTAGDIGTGGTSNQLTPTQVTQGLPSTATDPVVQVMATDSTSFALTTKGALYAWGDNTSGQIGTGTSGGSAVTTPVAVLMGATGLPDPTVDPISQLGSTAQTIFALTQSGAVYGWGDNSYGTLTTAADTNAHSTPTLITALPSGASNHTVLLSRGPSGSAMMAATSAMFTVANTPVPATSPTATPVPATTTPSPISNTPVPATATPPPSGWTVIAPSFSPATRNGSVAVGTDGKIYVFGGDSGGYSTPPVYSNATEIYDPVAKNWTSGAPYPNGALEGAGVVTFPSTGKILVAGGAFINVNGAPQRVAYLYDPVADSWTAIASMPGPLAGVGGSLAAVVASDGKAYVYGGTTGTGDVLTPYIYTPAMNRWTVGGALPASLDPGQGGFQGSALAADGVGNIYMTGGVEASTGTPLTTMLDYNTIMHTWSAQGIAAVTTAFGPAQSEVGTDGRVYVVGANSAAAYDSVADSWTTITPPDMVNPDGLGINAGTLYWVSGQSVSTYATASTAGSGGGGPPSGGGSGVSTPEMPAGGLTLLTLVPLGGAVLWRRTRRRQRCQRRA